MILHTHKKLTPEELEDIKNIAASDSAEFTAWVMPFFKERIQEAVKRKWRIQVGIAHYFLEGNAGLRVMLSGTKEKDGLRWIHLSASRSNKLPLWSELSKVKDLLLGEETQAIQAFPPRSQWVNDMPYCLHLWVCLDKEVFPDFRKEHPVTKKISM